MKLSEAIDRYCDALAANVAVGSRSAETYKTYRRHLEWMLNQVSDQEIRDVDGLVVDQVLSAYGLSGDRRSGTQGRKSVATQRLFAATIRSFFLYGLAHGWIQVNPMDSSSIIMPRAGSGPSNSARDALSYETAQELLKVSSIIDGSTQSSRLRQHTDGAVVSLCLLAGLRNGEVRSLNRSDLVLKNGVRSLRVVGKGSKERFIPAHVEVLGRLEKLWTLMDTMGLNDGDAALVGVGGKRITAVYVSRACQRVMKRVFAVRPDLWRPVMPHTLRHTAASLWLSSGVPLIQVRDLLGHASIATTNVYLQYAEATMSKGLDMGLFAEEEEKE